MASLSSGVLLKLLNDTEASSSASEDDAASPDRLSSRHNSRPALLQVTSIVPAPAGAGDDLSPDRGFYIRLSDASHSTYAALPKEFHELILTNRLRIGQLVHVTRLDPAAPVPILRGLCPLPARLPCLADTTNLIPTAGPEPVFLTGPTPPFPDGKKQRPARSASASRTREQRISIPATSPAGGEIKRRELARRSSDVLSELAKIGVRCVDEDYDSDSSRFSSSSSSSYSSSSCMLRPKTVRRSWEEPCRLKGRMRAPKPLVRRSASVSPNRSISSDTTKPEGRIADDLLAIKKETEAFKILGSSSKRKENIECSCTTNPSSSCSDVKWPESSVVWESLPSNLVKHGKEVLRQRDLALQAAVDALQEAYASEKLIQLLRMYSELKSNKESDPQHLVDMFLTFHSDLVEARLVTGTLSKLSSLKSCSFTSIPSSDSSIAAAKIIVERKRCAASWINAVMESELLRTPYELRTMVTTSEAPTTDAKLHISMASNSEPKCIDLVGKPTKTRKPTKTCAISPKRSTLLVATGLANTLNYECNRWFLNYIEKFLDDVENGTACISSECQIAGLLCQLKRVDDWLDSIAGKDSAWPSDVSKDNTTQEGEETEACGKVKKKIYGILLRHIESAAIALENMRATDEVTDQVQECSIANG